MSGQISLADVPVVDDHCHAGGYEATPGVGYRTIREHEELYARGYLEARIPAAAYREYVKAVHGRDAATLDRLDRAHGTRTLMERALELRQTMVLTRALELGCRELYGEWENREARDRAGDEARRQGPAALYERALDLANCPVVLTDTTRLDRSIWSDRRFKWISRLDQFFYPFGPGALTKRGTEVGAFYDRFEAALRVALRERGLDRVPTEFADYLAFVEEVLASVLERGAVCLKIVSAYVRSLEFRPVAEAEAARVFRDLVKGNKDESRLFEDYLARRLLLWAAKRDVPVQIHVGMGHGEPGMDYHGINPLNLQSVLMDERLSNLRVILLHGAYPYSSEVGGLAWTYGNVDLDFSWMPYLHHHFLVDRLCEWLEYLPAHKVLFGTDTGLPELHLGATRMGIRALETALGRGVADDLWTVSQARWLGERVCHRNACELYGFVL
ncbi:MAG: amidohydrolase family protein [Chloroflexi bacterium]|nr:amidohydrolase family protein [Chloroflexota bacterium]